MEERKLVSKRSRDIAKSKDRRKGSIITCAIKTSKMEERKLVSKRRVKRSWEEGV
ncbi:hypothetical protein U1Q18_038465, partial [Sarracenia purpurea var. burkii]